MPKIITPEEEAIIKATLLMEGEHLFSQYGLKKVTVDDIITKANIPRWKFYTLYKNKEHLFAAININLQEILYVDVKKTLAAHKNLPPKDLLMTVFKKLISIAMMHPILASVDVSTMQLLQRKVPKEVFDAHLIDDSALVDLMKNYGIEFTVHTELIAKTLQAIFACYNVLKQDEDCEQILEIMVSGVTTLLK